MRPFITHIPECRRCPRTPRPRPQPSTAQPSCAGTPVSPLPRRGGPHLLEAGVVPERVLDEGAGHVVDLPPHPVGPPLVPFVDEDEGVRHGALYLRGRRGQWGRYEVGSGSRRAGLPWWSARLARPNRNPLGTGLGVGDAAGRAIPRGIAVSDRSAIREMTRRRWVRATHPQYSPRPPPPPPGLYVRTRTRKRLPSLTVHSPLAHGSSGGHPPPRVAPVRRTSSGTPASRHGPGGGVWTREVPNLKKK